MTSGVLMTKTGRVVSHGTTQAYNKYGCRCCACKQVISDRYLEKKGATPSKPTPHGTLTGYNGYNCRCDLCVQAHRDYRRDYKARCPEVARRSQRAFRLKERDLSLSEYETLEAAQGGVCAICQNPEVVTSADGTPKALAVDHDHDTGEIRGLLCQRCNVGLGYFKDSPELLRRSADYLTTRGEGR